MKFEIRSLPLLAFFLAAPLLADDLTIVSKVTRDGAAPKTSVSYLSADRVRVAQGDGKEVIVELGSGRMTTLDDAKKTYFVTTREDLEKFAERLKEQMNSPEMRKAREAMKNLPAEDRKRADEAMGGMFDVEVRKAGTARRIAGYPCEDWIVSIGRFSRSEECLTQDLKFPAQAFDMYRGMADSMKSVMASFGPMAADASKMTEQFKKMKGYPLANTTTVDVMGHKSVVATEVTEIRRGPIPASAWEIPAGYRKTDNPMLKAFDRSRRK